MFFVKGFKIMKKEMSSKDNKFNIKGQFKEGRPAYLDFQATTPMDPRVYYSLFNMLIFFEGSRSNATLSIGKVW